MSRVTVTEWRPGKGRRLIKAGDVLAATGPNTRGARYIFTGAVLDDAGQVVEIKCYGGKPDRVPGSRAFLPEQVRRADADDSRREQLRSTAAPPPARRGRR